MVNFLKNTLKPICIVGLIMCVFPAISYAQEEDSSIKWLNANSATTYRVVYYEVFSRSLVESQYSFKPLFLERGIFMPHQFSRGQSTVIPWEEIDFIAKTKTNRVAISWINEDFIVDDERDKRTTQYLTPSDGVSLDTYISELRNALFSMGNETFRYFSDYADNDENFRLKQEQEEEAILARAQEIDDLMSLFGSAWEFEGTMVSGYDETDSELYGGHYTHRNIAHLTSKLKFIYGTKRVRLMMAPVSFSWTTLPSYTRLDDKGEMINRDNLGAITSYSPEIGLQFVYFPTKEMDNPDREWEILLNVGYAALFPFKAKDLEDSGSELSDYLPSYNDLLSSSLELNLFPTPGFGFGLVGGLRKLRMPTTAGQLSGTYFDKDVSFTAKFDDLKTLLPFFGAKMIVRFQ